MPPGEGGNRKGTQATQLSSEAIDDRQIVMRELYELVVEAPRYHAELVASPNTS